MRAAVIASLAASLGLTQAGVYDADLCTSSEWGIYDTRATNTKLCWRVVGDELEVALEAPTGNWAAFGMSNTQTQMVGLDAYFFLATGNTGTVENRNAASTTRPTLDNDTPTYRAIQSIATSPGDTSRQVVFRRPLAASSNGNRIAADAGPVFTLWATGPVSGAGAPEYHTARSFGSSTSLAAAPTTPAPAAPTTPVPSGSPTTPAPVSAGEYDADLCTSSSEWGIYDTSAPNTKLCWRVVGDELEVALEAPTDNWAAFGMSNTQRQMVGLDAYFFLATGTAGTVENRNAAGTTTPTLDNDTPTYRAIQSIATSPGDTSRQVVFRRPLAASSNGNRIAADADSVFTLWATGPVSGAGAPQYHTAKSFGSSTSLAAVGAVDVTIVKFATGLKQAHGLCMILAWIFLCPTAIIDARAAKGVLTKGGWYQLHRNCQMLAVVLTIAGYFLIQSDKSVHIDENSSDTRRQHQLIGNVVTFLSIFQICLGLLRNIISGANKEGYDKEKHPHGPRRIIFNVLHILTGIALIFLSWNNVMTGTYIDCAGDACDEMEGWVKTPVRTVIAAGTYFAMIAYILMGILQLAKNKGYVSSETIVDVVGRHVLAQVAALTFAAAVTAITIVYDSNNF